MEDTGEKGDQEHQRLEHSGHVLSNLLERCSKSDEKPQKAIMDGLEEGQRKIKVYKQRAWFGILSLQDLPKVALHILAWQA